MSQDQKKKLIIEAAQKRFSHFGVGKTTMNEIAEDLAISKASLYYYFPDKLNLYAAVLQTIVEASEESNGEVISEQSPLKALNKYLDLRIEFIIEHYNILEYLKTVGSGVPKELETVFSLGRTREIAAITAIITKGAEAKLLKANEPQKIAELLLDCLNGLRLSVISDRNNFLPNKDQFRELSLREKELAAIFMKGLSI